MKIEIQTRQSIKRMIADDTAGFYKELSKLKNKIKELEDRIENGGMIVR